jgi:methylated-DNA-[protein]-cysteine S-methyltransferase
MNRTDFTKKVLEIVVKIPLGKLMTYQQIAKLAGSPKAYRAVGSILNRNYRRKEWQLPLDEIEPVPCHRVIRSDGYVGGYAKGPKDKIKILELEGHVIVGGRIKTPDLANIN